MLELLQTIERRTNYLDKYLPARSIQPRQLTEPEIKQLKAEKRELARIMLEKKLLTQGITEAEAIKELIALGVDAEDLQPI